MNQPRSAQWAPSASINTIKARAKLYAMVRAFFAARGILEVDTPILSAHATVDRNIESFQISEPKHWLQTSPEFAMKRLLAAGSGPIWQLAKSFRLEEQGRFHNPEFTLLEWYRPEWNHLQLMGEVEELFWQLQLSNLPMPRLSYRQLFIDQLQLDPFTAAVSVLKERAARLGLETPQEPLVDDDRDYWLDGLMSMAISPTLGQDHPLFVYDFPASQAALARIRNDQPPVAERFEVFWKGIELANGFHELADAEEQRARFADDLRIRSDRGQVQPPYDAHLIQALSAGLPNCAGVAIGIDRLLMLQLGLRSLSAALSFDIERA